jgi:hypothetical protein
VLQGPHLELCSTLIDRCVATGLLVGLSEVVLLVLGLDPAPFEAQGPHGVDQLTDAVVLAMQTVRSLQSLVQGR